MLTQSRLTGEQSNEIEKDPIRLKAYFWHVAMNAKRLAIKNRKNMKIVSFEEGRQLLNDSIVLDNFSKVVLDNIDLLVESSIK